MSVIYQNNFDALTAGAAVAGWTDITGQPFVVRTHNPVSGTKSFGTAAYSAGSIAVYTGMTAQADLCAQISQVVQKNGGNAGANVGIALRCSSDGANGYFFLPEFGGNLVYIFKKVSGGFTLLGSNASGISVANGDTALMKAEIEGDTLKWKLWKSTESEPGTWGHTRTDSSIAGAGKVGLYTGENTGSGGTTPSCDDLFIGDVGEVFTPGGGGEELAAGTISLDSKTDTTANLTVAAPTGGTAPYTYQWHRSTSSGFTPDNSNDLPGETGLTLNDTGLSAATTYYYKVVQTDDAAASVTTAQLSVTTDAGPTNTITINDANWFFSPYNWRKSGGTYALTNNPGAYFKTKFTGTSFKLNVDVDALSGESAGNYPAILYSVDGGAWTRYQLLSSDTQLTLATGLASATHTITVYLAGAWYSSDRWNTPVMALKVTGCELDSGADLSAPDLKAGRMIVYGDSNSEGYEALTFGVSVTNQDATQAAPILIGEAFDCEVGVIAFAAQGFTTSSAGNVPSLSSSWDDYYSGQTRLSGGLFSPAPDFIVSLMGQNDGGDVTATVTTLIADWRTAAPDATIFICSPSDLSHAAQLQAAVTAAADDNTFYVSTGITYLGTWSSGAGKAWTNANHLSARGHARYAARLIQEMQEAVTPVGGNAVFPLIGSFIIQPAEVM